MFEIVLNAASEGRLEDLKDLVDQLPQSEVSSYLVHVGLKVNGSKFQVLTPLLVSCWNGKQKVVEYILDKCPASVEQTGSFIEGEKIERATLLWFAAVAGHLDIVKMLVKRGAKVNSETKTKSTRLQAASMVIMRLSNI